MAITDFTSGVQLFTVGRAPGPAAAIVLHEYCSDLGSLDLQMERCARPRPAQSPGCHTSFHYGISGSFIHQYVALANTAWGFGVTPPSCPEPLCPPDPCESCTGITADQYQPDIDGNAPVLPVWVAGADGTVNNRVIHVAVAGSCNRDPNNCCLFLTNDKAYTQFVTALAEIFVAAGLVASQTTLLVHCEELNCIDIDQLVIDVNAVVPVAPFVGCECITDVDPGDGLTMSITGGAIVTDIELDPDPSNILSLSPDGLLAVSSGAPGVEVDSAVAPGGSVNVNTPGAANRYLIVSNVPGGNIDLILPVAQPDLDIYIKNIGTEALTITPIGTTIDGVALITLAGTTAGTYPFGNNGGESVHLLWDSVGGDWYVL